MRNLIDRVIVSYSITLIFAAKTWQNNPGVRTPRVFALLTGIAYLLGCFYVLKEVYK